MMQAHIAGHVRGTLASATAEQEFKQSWRTLLASTVGVALGAQGIAFYSFGEFVGPLAGTFQWSRGEISAGMLVFSIAQLFIAPFIGGAIERLGMRTAALLAQFGLALGFGLLSLVQEQILTFYAAYLALSILGAGTSPIVWTRAVNGAFSRSRGLALGITLSGTGVIAVLAPLVTSQVIVAFGWRTAYQVLGGSVLLIGMPVTYALLHPPMARVQKVHVAGAGGTLAEALRDWVFWRIMLAFFLMAIALVGLVVNLPLMLADNGFSVAEAGFRVALLGYAVIVGRLVLGSLLDRFPPAIIGAAVVALGSLASLMIANDWGVVAAVLLLGLCSGADGDLLAFLTSRLFGLRHYARIYGCGISAFAAGAGLGPVVAGMIRDQTGSYTLVLYLFAITTACAAALVASLGPRLAVAKHRADQADIAFKECAS